MRSREWTARRRGSRREEPILDSGDPVEQPSLAQRVLEFESYIGFQHEYIGIFAGLVVAIGLWVERGARRTRA